LDIQLFDYFIGTFAILVDFLCVLFMGPAFFPLSLVAAFPMHLMASSNEEEPQDI
jgi:hypothetical protein